MKLVHLLSLSLVIAAVGTPMPIELQGRQQAPQPAHGGAGPNFASHSLPDSSRRDTARMDRQLQAMRDIHGRMMAASTPAGRDALMAAHIKALHDGMTMIGATSVDGLDGASLIDDPPLINALYGSGMGNIESSMDAHHRMMNKRVAMTQAIMRMMMDRSPVAPREAGLN